MKSRTRFTLVIALTLCAAWGNMVLNSAQPIENHRFFNFPMVIGSWEGREIPMNNYVYQGIETDYLFMRDYFNPHGEKVNLALVWFDDTNIAFHTPEACLGGIGEQVKEQRFMTLNLGRNINVVWDMVEVAGMRQLMLYFFDVDGNITISQSSIRLLVLKKRLAFSRASVSFVRLMAPVGTSKQETEELMIEFLKNILPILPDYTYTERVSSPHSITR
jgi:EpsI family protein